MTFERALAELVLYGVVGCVSAGLSAYGLLVLASRWLPRTHPS